MLPDQCVSVCHGMREHTDYPGVGGGRDERMEEEDDGTEGREGRREGGGDEIEQRTELRPGSGEKLSSFHFHFPFISLQVEPRVGAFHMDGVPKFRSTARWHRSVGK